MGWTFNPPPGWPSQPPGWSPPPGWTPDPSWPPPPAGWQFWVATSPATAAAAPFPPPHSTPHPPGRPPRAWFARWWGVLGLAGALLVGGLVGFGGTSLALSGDGDETPTALDTPQPSAPAAPTGEPQPSPDPSPGPTGLPTGGPDEMCGAVAVIMVQMLGDNLDAFEQDDPQAELVASRRAAAEALRDVEAAEATDQEALDTFADELDAAADDLASGPMNEERYIDFVDRGSAAWDDFNAATGC